MRSRRPRMIRPRRGPRTSRRRSCHKLAHRAPRCFRRRRARGDSQPHQQPVQQGWEPEGEDGGGVHADRAGQQRLGGGWPGLGGVVPGAGQAQQDPEHVDQPHRQVLVGAEEDGGDLADQPDQPAGGEQQRRHHQPEGVGDVVVLAVGVAVTPHPSHLLPGRAGWASRRQVRQRRWPSGV